LLNIIFFSVSSYFDPFDTSTYSQKNVILAVFLFCTEAIFFLLWLSASYHVSYLLIFLALINLYQEEKRLKQRYLKEQENKIDKNKILQASAFLVPKFVRDFVTSGSQTFSLRFLIIFKETRIYALKKEILPYAFLWCAMIQKA